MMSLWIQKASVSVLFVRWKSSLQPQKLIGRTGPTWKVDVEVGRLYARALTSQWKISNDFVALHNASWRKWCFDGCCVGSTTSVHIQIQLQWTSPSWHSCMGAFSNSWSPPTADPIFLSMVIIAEKNASIVPTTTASYNFCLLTSSSSHGWS